MSASTAGRGRLLAFEGLDGVGKSTQARLLAAYLQQQGLPVVLTREPTDGLYGRQLRQLRLQERRQLPPQQELALFLADRRQHVEEVIRPALAAGRIVITDRYYYSTMAYQGALGLDPADIEAQHAGWAPPADLVILLELPARERRLRLAQRGTVGDAFEQEDYLAKVAAIFDRLEAPGLIRVDARGTPDEVLARILPPVQRLLQQSGAAGPS